MTQLIRYEQARKALSEAVAFDEVMTIMNVAEQAALYAKQAGDNELIEKATEIRVRAQRKAGEMLRQSAEQGTRATVSSGVERGANKHLSVGSTSAPTLAEIGVSKHQSSHYQQLAAMPAEHFETAVAAAKATAGEVTTAFMLREAGRARPNKRLNNSDKEKLGQLEERKGASMLAGYARMVLRGLRETESLSEEERTTLAALRDEINSALAH